MLSALIVVAATVVLGLVTALLASFYFLDRLIHYEYTFHRQAWEQDGRPIGFFFRPPECRWFRSGMAFQRCALAWPLHTPSWVRGDPAARALHRRLRWSVVTWNLGAIVWLVLLLPRLLPA
jgi:hypothetical protein